MSNILFVNMLIDPACGGVETVMNTLCEIFQENGHNVLCACNAQAHVPPGLKYNQILQDWRLLNKFIYDNNVDIVINQATHDKHVTKIISKVRESYPNMKIISCLHNDPYFLYSNLRKSLSIRNLNSLKPAIRTLIKYSYLPFYWINNRKRIKANYAQVYSLSNTIVLLSKSYIESYKEIAKLNDVKKIIAIANPIISERIFNKELKQPIVLIVSRLTDIKRIDLALRIWKLCENNATINTTWSLHIVGDGPAKKKLQELTAKLNIKNVTFTGYQSNPTEEYQKASIFMMCSLYEGFGLTLVEAQSKGVVPIAFDSYSTLHDIIANDIDGLIIPNNDINKYTKALEHMISHPETLERLAKQAVMSSEKFTPERIYSQWLTIL